MLIDQLKALVLIVQKIGIETLEDFSVPPGKKESLIMRFYRLLLSDETPEDERELAELLLGDKYSNAHYKVLKNRIKKQLSATVLNLSVNTDTFSDSFKAWYGNSRELIVAEVLTKLGKQTAGIEIIQEIYKQATYYHLTDLQIRSLDHLRSHFALTGEKKKYRDTKALLSHSLAVRQAEIDAVSHYEDVAILYANKHSERPENLPFAREKLRLIRILFDQYDSFKIKDRYWALASLIGQIDLNYDTVMEATDEAITYLKEHPHLVSKNMLGLYLSEKVLICFSHRKYEEARVAIEECKLATSPNTSRWLSLKMTETLLNLHTDHEREAWEIVRHVKSTLKESSGGMVRYGQEWKILEGYCYYARMTTILRPSEDEITALPDPVRVFAGGFLEFFDDKEGANLSMLLCHILLISLSEESKTDFSNKIALLDRYRLRNLKNKQSQRGAYFIELLRAMVRADYNQATTNRLAKPILAKMQNFTICENYEILPFEKTWHRLVERMTVKTIRT
ncbi:MAG: hypothetical protein IPM69_07345 [Ignavibacteria bacterium]|nr:hypothetical protein [Ignavibacteria bacterium]